MKHFMLCTSVLMALGFHVTFPKEMEPAFTGLGTT